MSATDTIAEAVRAWLMLANGITNHASVILADGAGTRPPKPYLTVKVTADDLPRGEAETYETLGYTVTVTGGTTGTVYTLTINGTVRTYTRAAGLSHAQTATAIVAMIVAAESTVFAEGTAADLVISPILGALTLAVGANLTIAVDTVPIELTRGVSTATISIQGFGSGAQAWLITARRRLRSPSVIAQNDVDCVTIRADGAVSNLTAILDTGFEPRFLLEAEVDYAWAEHGETMIALGTVTTVLTTELYTGAPAPLTNTITVEV